ncbi:hypothetical protein CEXT_426561 [Caerostris extrusa]|uniref:Uncharacterized protein n=1 Tax=Caerostris extrusa TaxID=172846 RepID=A0AAV4Y271_CAEEX|nr:hypothetical protein CEXT_426561 [Caerostris extrusa]
MSHGRCITVNSVVFRRPMHGGPTASWETSQINTRASITTPITAADEHSLEQAEGNHRLLNYIIDLSDNLRCGNTCPRSVSDSIFFVPLPYHPFSSLPFCEWGETPSAWRACICGEDRRDCSERGTSEVARGWRGVKKSVIKRMLQGDATSISNRADCRRSANLRGVVSCW